MRRTPSTPVPSAWAVAADGWGHLVVVDESGTPVLRNPDPVRALEHAHLAAAAPLLRHVVAGLVRRLERIEVDHGVPIMSRDEQTIGLAWFALLSCTPPTDQLETARSAQTQLEIRFDDVA